MGFHRGEMALLDVQRHAGRQQQEELRRPVAGHRHADRRDGPTRERPTADHGVAGDRLAHTERSARVVDREAATHPGPRVAPIDLTVREDAHVARVGALGVVRRGGAGFLRCRPGRGAQRHQREQDREAVAKSWSR